MNEVAVTRTSTTAIISLVFGILTWFGLPLIGAIVAVICGHAARSEIRASGGRLQGDGMALGGLIMGWLHLLFFAVLVWLLFMVPVSLFGGFGGIVHWLHHLDCGTTAT